MGLLLFLPLSCITQVEKKIPVYVTDQVAQDTTANDLTTDVDDASDAAGETEDQTDSVTSDATDSQVEPDSITPVETATIGTAGGHVLFVGGLSLDIPEGALTQDVEFEALKFAADPPEDVAFLTDVWTVLPEGTEFLLPVTVTLPRTGAPAADEWSSLVAYVNPGQEFDGETTTAKAWGVVGGATVSFQTLHFSIFAVGAGTTSSTCLDHELCNNKDDDCDGSTDEDLTDPALSTCLQVGVCAGNVDAVCQDGDWVCTYTSPNYEEGGETSCDLKDNDCDGSTDEGIFGSADLLPEAGCRVEGVCAVELPFAMCAMGQWFCDYSDVPYYEGEIEAACDERDNDCDGETDEEACKAFQACTGPEKCRTGGCVVPFGDSEATRCTAELGACLVLTEDVSLEVVDEGTYCADGMEILVCENGTWSQPTLCSDLLSGYATCNLETNSCDIGCEQDVDCEDDGNLCNGTPICDQGECILDAATVVTCKPNDCNIFVCAPSTGLCVPSPANNGGTCHDGNLCHLDGTCAAGVCVSAGPVVCDDLSECTEDSCDEETGDCVFDPTPYVGDGCSDENLCTLEDTCSEEGLCVGADKDCDDGSPCTIDSCDQMTGDCSYDSDSLEGQTCEDDSLCTSEETCQSGQCEGLQKSCDDLNDCTDDSCDPETGLCGTTDAQGGETCRYPSADEATLDPCTPSGLCNASGDCLPGEDLCDCRQDSDCEAFDNGNRCDGLYRCDTDEAPYQCVYDPDSVVHCGTAQDTPCRTNQCNTATGICSLTALPDQTPCNDNDVCSQTQDCRSGECTPLTTLDCADDEECTEDLCDSVTGCYHQNKDFGELCDDNNNCTRNDHCSLGHCVSDEVLDCDDSIFCTLDLCLADGLTCSNEAIENCCEADGDCNTAGGQVCFQDQCCAPICQDVTFGTYECGDDQCGSTCGDCAADEVCTDHFCCRPNCDGKTCGEDGCGDVCGTCTTGQTCDATFHCCTLTCDGRECGSNGCGGVCGTCQSGFRCNEATFHCEVCTPNCTGKDCGDDGCGGSCGTCSSGEQCLAGGTCCAPNCAGHDCGDDGCGGSCGTCAAYETCESGVCTCADCCSSDKDCLVHELCTGVQQDGGNVFNTCELHTARTYRDFEAGTVGAAPTGFTFDWAQYLIPFKIKRNTNGSISTSGYQSVEYYQYSVDNGTMTLMIRLPPQTTPVLARLSFEFLCNLGASGAWNMTIAVNGHTLGTIGPAQCIAAFNRYTYDLGTVGSGVSTLTFQIVKTNIGVVRFYIDDLEILTDGCPTDLSCVTFTTSDSVCVAGTPTANTCFVDWDCYANGAASSRFECAACLPQMSQTVWSASSALCDDGNPATTDGCTESTFTCTNN